MSSDQHKQAAQVGGGTMSLIIGDGGRASAITFTPGIERFIGVYPRLDGLCPRGQLLKFAPAD